VTSAREVRFHASSVNASFRVAETNAVGLQSLMRWNLAGPFRFGPHRKAVSQMLICRHGSRE